MRYELGNMDRYFTAVNGTSMENTPFFIVCLDEPVDKARLTAAVSRALCYFPLFKTRLRYEKQYFLETNDAPVTVTHASATDRPKTFGIDTGEYPWRVSYFEKELYFEWCHAITDGTGAKAFLTKVLHCYYEVPMPDVPDTFPLSLGFESFLDTQAKPIGQKKQEKGFSLKALPVVPNGPRCESHLLSMRTEDVMKVAKSYGTTPVAILTPLLCRAVRSCIPADVKNRNVCCNILVNCRTPMHFDTMHNFFLTKFVTYTDRFDRHDLATLGTVYRGILDLFVQPETIRYTCTAMVKNTDALYRLRPLWLKRLLFHIAAPSIKKANNIALSYLGRTEFDPAVAAHVKRISLRVWPDTGYGMAAVIDHDGTLYFDFSENYADKEIVPAFMRECEKEGIPVTLLQEETFEQAVLKVNYDRTSDHS